MFKIQNSNSFSLKN